MARVLVVDDDAFARFATRAMVEAEGHEVREANDGDAALAVAVDIEPDIVITDMIMPGRHGLDAARELLSTYPQVKLIAVSGGGREGFWGDMVEAREIGVHATLVKPFEQDERQAAVASALRAELPVW